MQTFCVKPHVLRDVIFMKKTEMCYTQIKIILQYMLQKQVITITLPETSNVTEVYERKCYAKGADRFSFHMVRGTTKMFEVKGI